MSETSWTPVVAFDRDSADFTHGFEMGRLWEQLHDPEPFVQTIHSCNVEMVMRMVESGELPVREVRVDDSPDETWCYVVAEAAGT